MTRDEAYDAGLYAFSPPPVCTAHWSRRDWMRAVTFTVEVDDDEENQHEHSNIPG